MGVHFNFFFSFPFSNLMATTPQHTLAPFMPSVAEEYNAFVAEIQAASEEGDFQLLQEKRQRMHEKFPLTPGKSVHQSLFL